MPFHRLRVKTRRMNDAPLPPMPYPPPASPPPGYWSTGRIILWTSIILFIFVILMFVVLRVLILLRIIRSKLTYPPQTETELNLETVWDDRGIPKPKRVIFRT